MESWEVPACLGIRDHLPVLAVVLALWERDRGRFASRGVGTPTAVGYGRNRECNVPYAEGGNDERVVCYLNTTGNRDLLNLADWGNRAQRACKCISSHVPIVKAQ